MPECNLGGNLFADFIEKGFLKLTLKKNGEAENVFYLDALGVDELFQYILDHRKQKGTRVG